jgi:hypothetical protein
MDYWFRAGGMGGLQECTCPLFVRLHLSFLVGITANFYMPWRKTRILEYEGIIMRETASQLEGFLGLNKDPGIFFRTCQEAGFGVKFSITFDDTPSISLAVRCKGRTVFHRSSNECQSRQTTPKVTLVDTPKLQPWFYAGTQPKCQSKFLVLGAPSRR